MNNFQETRQIRIFISSTFQDMQEERDYLMTRTFPKLRRLAARRDVSLVELDLRWGITPEESENGKVLQICLNEIDNSRPFFIGILGDRYGWCPPEDELSKNTNILERYQWVREYIAQGKSVTEMEMQYGVLNKKIYKENPHDINAAFYIKQSTGGCAENDDAAQKLKELKEAVRRNIGNHPCSDYTTPENLGEQVEREFTALLDRIFPEGELTALQKERLAQSSFMHSHSAVYISDEKNFRALDAFLDDKKQRYLVVTGPSGMGKSALVANWIERHINDTDRTMIYHFVGYGGMDADYGSIQQRLIDEIRDLYGFPAPEHNKVGRNDEENDPTKVLQDLVNRATAKKHLLIILDGINQLVENEDSKLLNWLPTIPVGSKMLFSTLENDATMETFKRREYPLFVLEPLDIDRRCNLIRSYLGKFGKSLLDSQVVRIANDKENENTLVLRTLLNEIRSFGVHEELDMKINSYIEANSIEEFFDRVLTRAENDYGEVWVRNAFMLIAVSQNGLSETELLEISGQKRLYWSELYCAFIDHLNTRNGLVGFSHQYIRNAVSIRYADSEKEFREKIVEYMDKIFDESEDIAVLTRCLEELAWQYYKLKDHSRLNNLLLGEAVFNYFYNQRSNMLYEYWKWLVDIEDGKYYSLSQYLTLADNRDADYDLWNFCYNVRSFSDGFFKNYNVTLEADEKLVEISRVLAESDSDYDAMLAESLGAISLTHIDLNQYEEAEAELEEAVEIYHRLADENPDKYNAGLAEMLTSLGKMYYDLHRIDLAENAWFVSLDLLEKLEAQFPGEYEYQKANCMSNIGLVLMQQMQLGNAEAAFREAQKICKTNLEKNPEAYGDLLARICGNITAFYEQYGEMIKMNNDDIDDMYNECLALYRQLAGKKPEVYEANVARILCAMSSFHEFKCISQAESEIAESVEIYRRLANVNHDAYDNMLADAIKQHASIFEQKEDYLSAENFYNESIVLYRHLAEIKFEVYSVELAGCLSLIALLHQNYMKKLDVAEKEFAEIVEIYRKLCVQNEMYQYQENYIKSLCDLACIHSDNEKYELAEHEYLKAISIVSKSIEAMTEIENDDDFDAENKELIIKSFYGSKAEILTNLADLYVKMQKYDLAKDKYEEVLSIYSKLSQNSGKRKKSRFDVMGIVEDNADEIVRIHENMAKMYELQGIYESAENEYDICLDIIDKFCDGGDLGTWKLLVSIGKMHLKAGKYKQAEKEIEKAQKTCRHYAKKNKEEIQKRWLKFVASNFNLLAKVHLGEQKYKKALEDINESISILPDTPEFYDTKGEILLAMGKRDEALEMWHKVMELDPDYPEHSESELYNGLFGTNN